eukprot:3096507-Rhodomonas_salina.10
MCRLKDTFRPSEPDLESPLVLGVHAHGSHVRAHLRASRQRQLDPAWFDGMGWDVMGWDGMGWDGRRGGWWTEGENRKRARGERDREDVLVNVAQHHRDVVVVLGLLAKRPATHTISHPTQINTHHQPPTQTT